MEPTNTLDLFGQEFIEKVRDLSIEKYLMIRDGKMNSDQAKKINNLIVSFTDEEKIKIDQIVFEVIDRVVFNSLRIFEDSEQFTIIEKDQARAKNDIVKLSDGLTGELYSEDGWIKKYSKFPAE